MMVGLFSDWRDVTVSTDYELATVLGVAVQVAFMIRQRHWSVFNCLRKPERTVVNIQPLDLEPHGDFVQLYESLHFGGDTLGSVQRRDAMAEWARQPVAFSIQQQDALTWWICVNIG